MNKIRIDCRLVSALVVAHLLSIPPNALAATSDISDHSDQVEINILESTEGAIRVEFRFDILGFEEAMQEGEHDQTHAVAGIAWTQHPGMPRLPTTGIMLAVPSHNDLVVEIVEREIKPYVGPLPEPIQESQPLEGKGPFVLPGRHNDQDQPTNASTPADDTIFPLSPIALTETGYMRDQAVVQLQFTPIQIILDTKAAQINRRLVIDIRWTMPIQAASAPRSAPGTAYTTILDATLGNYEAGHPLGAAEITLPTDVETHTEHVDESTATSRLKITIQDTGIYILTYADLASAGHIPVDIDPTLYQMHSAGEKVAIHVAGGEDGSFDPGDGIIFYGKSYQDRYTDFNVYLAV